MEDRPGVTDCTVPIQKEVSSPPAALSDANLASNIDLNAPRLSLSPRQLASISPHASHMIAQMGSGDVSMNGVTSLPSPVSFPMGPPSSHFVQFPEAALRSIAIPRPSHSTNPFLCSPGQLTPYLSVSPTNSLGCLPSTSPPGGLNFGVPVAGGLSLHPASSYPPPNSRQHPHPTHSLTHHHHHHPVTLALSNDSYFSLSSSPTSSGLASPTSVHPNPTSSLFLSRSAFLFPNSSLSSSSSPSSSLQNPQQDVTMETQSVVVSEQNVMDSLVTVRSARNPRVRPNTDRHSFSEGDVSNPNTLSLPASGLSHTHNHTHGHTHSQSYSGPTRTRRNSSGSEQRIRRLSHGPSLTPTSESMSLRRQRRRSHDARDGQMDLLESLAGNFRVRRQSRNGVNQPPMANVLRTNTESSS